LFMKPEVARPTDASIERAERKGNECGGKERRKQQERERCWKCAAFTFLLVRQAWRVARERKRGGCGGHFVDLEVKVLCRP